MLSEPPPIRVESDSNHLMLHALLQAQGNRMNRGAHLSNGAVIDRPGNCTVP